MAAAYPRDPERDHIAALARELLERAGTIRLTADRMGLPLIADLAAVAQQAAHTILRRIGAQP